jgi:heme-degrading monooxygenase HmoA
MSREGSSGYTRSMFSVLFEVHPKPDRWDTYLGYAKMLRPELEQVDGFVDNIRYKSLTRDGWVLSLSNWRDEKAVVRWRTTVRHHDVQEKGRNDVFLDYHLRVGQLTHDTRLPPGHALHEQRLDETEVGAATAVSLIDAPMPAGQPKPLSADAVASYLGFRRDAPGLVGWDVFEAVLTPGDAILMLSWRDDHAATSFERSLALPDRARLRRVRIIRDYAMFDRREAPQYYPEAPRF